MKARSSVRQIQVRDGVKHSVPNPLIEPAFILEQELDEIPSYCSSCGRVHGTEDCGLHNDDY
jgi:hypothetical protein